MFLCYIRLTGGISIHAPTRGATKGAAEMTKAIREFQSTLPREERLSLKSDTFDFYTNFNPRSHERSDCAIYTN